MQQKQDPSDQELMVRYQDGDEAAFQLLYSRYARRLMGYLMGRLRNRSQAEDVFQAVFMKFHKSRSSYNSTLPVEPWIFTIARNALLDFYRTQKTQQAEWSNDAALAAAPAPVAEETQDSLPSLSGLPAAQKEAVTLRYADDLPFDEIARRLETTPSNARQLVSRALKKLRSLYETS